MAKLLEDDRVLCVDGGCIGLVGDDGRCKECGKPGPSGAAVASRSSEAADESADDESPAAPSWSDEFEDDDDDDDGDDDASSGDGERLKAPDDFDDRQLCPDGGCLGLIGPSGACTTCGARPGQFEEE